MNGTVKPAKKIGINTLISWGATIVIIGLTFKILHWNGGEWMIAIGLLTEACLFFILGLNYINKDDAIMGGSEVAAPRAEPQRSNDLDNLLNTSINPSTIERLSRSFEHFNQTVESVNQATQQATGYANATRNMIDEVQAATREIEAMRKNIADINSVYRAQLEAFRK